MRVIIDDIDLSFGCLVKLMVKASLAAIPAAIILAILWYTIGVLIIGSIVGVVRHLGS